MRLKIYVFSTLTLLCFSLFVGISTADETTPTDLIHAQGCKGCHRLDDTGGTFGPALEGIGNRLTYEQLRQKLINPKTSVPTSLMPNYRHLTKAELKLLTDYLAHLR